MKAILNIAHTMLNAMAFANAGNQREFETMLCSSTRVASDDTKTEQTTASHLDVDHMFPSHSVSA